MAGQKILKTLLIGDEGVGKTAILNRFAYSRFNKFTKSTRHLDFASKNGNSVTHLVWDTPSKIDIGSNINNGQVSVRFLRGTSAFIWVIDGTKEFNLPADTKSQLQSLQKAASNAKFYIAVSKGDAPDFCYKDDSAKENLIQNLVKRTKDIGIDLKSSNVVFCSAQKGININETFDKIESDVLQPQQEDNTEIPSTNESSSVGSYESPGIFDSLIASIVDWFNNLNLIDKIIKWWNGEAVDTSSVDNPLPSKNLEALKGEGNSGTINAETSLGINDPVFTPDDKSSPATLTTATSRPKVNSSVKKLDN